VKKIKIASISLTVRDRVISPKFLAHRVLRQYFLSFLIFCKK